MIRFALVVALLLALPMPSAASPRTPSPAYPEYQALLDQYCIRLGDGSQAGDTRFDYEQLYVDDHVLSLKHSDHLDRVHTELLSVNPAELSERDRLAWAINTHNFLVIERITLHLLLPVKKKFIRYRSVDEIDGGPGRFYLAPTVTFEGRAYTVRQAERRLVYGDTTDAGFRLHGADPRIALALCTGRAGGPPLAPRAYRGDSLEAQLDLAARTALALPRFLHVDAEHARLEVGAYLAQQRADYGTTIDAIVPFLLKYAPRPERDAIGKAKLKRVTGLVPMDPLLNQFERPKGQGPAGQTSS